MRSDEDQLTTAQKWWIPIHFVHFRSTKIKIQTSEKKQTTFRCHARMRAVCTYTCSRNVPTPHSPVSLSPAFLSFFVRIHIYVRVLPVATAVVVVDVFFLFSCIPQSPLFPHTHTQRKKSRTESASGWEAKVDSLRRWPGAWFNCHTSYGQFPNEWQRINGL